MQRIITRININTRCAHEKLAAVCAIHWHEGARAYITAYYGSPGGARAGRTVCIEFVFTTRGIISEYSALLCSAPRQARWKKVDEIPRVQARCACGFTGEGRVVGSLTRCRYNAMQVVDWLLRWFVLDARGALRGVLNAGERMMCCGLGCLDGVLLN